MKRTPLRRLKRLERGKALKRMSKKHQQVIRERIEARLAAPPAVCEHPDCISPATDWHERLPRSQGGSATHPANRVYLCRTHHEWVHSHPQEAHALGLRRWSWEGESDE